MFIISGFGAAQIDFMLLSGGDAEFNIVRNPFPVSTGYVTVDITSPQNKTYYTNNIDLNYTITGTLYPSSTCGYKINTGSWNIINCTGYHPHRTFVEGVNTLTVRVVQLGTTYTNTIQFTVRTVPYGKPMKFPWILAYPLILIGFLYLTGNIEPSMREDSM